MLKLETQQGFQGFGDGALQGEFYHSVNMVPTSFGLAPFLANKQSNSSAVLTNLGLARWFAEEAGAQWALSPQYVFTNASGSWVQQKDLSSLASSANGMALDQTLRLLVMNDRYLSKKDSSGAGATWTTNWKDFGSAVTGDKGMDTFRDWVVIPHGNTVGLLNVTDDSFQTAVISFPTGCTCIIAKSNQTGILLGVNMGNRSFVGLWDAQANGTISDWLWFDNPLKSICRAAPSQYGSDQWIVTTTREIVLTNGYTKQLLTQKPLLGQILFNPVAGGTLSDGSNFYLAHTINGTNYRRRQSGIYRLDMNTGLWTYTPPSDNCRQQVSMGGIFQDSSGQIWNGHTNSASGIKYISQLSNVLVSSASLISAPFGISGSKKVAEAAKVELVANNEFQAYDTMSFDVSIKLYDFTRPLWTFGTQSVNGAAANQITVNGTAQGQNNAVIGDEVTVLTGANAGQIRHITAISGQNTSTEVWTLDSSLPNTPLLNDLYNIQPFHLINKFTSVTSIPVDGFFFNVQNGIKGKRFLVKVLLENINANTPLSIASLSFLYDDLGFI